MNTIDLTADSSDDESENDDPIAIAQALERFTKPPAPPHPVFHATHVQTKPKTSAGAANPFWEKKTPSQQLPSRFQSQSQLQPRPQSRPRTAQNESNSAFQYPASNGGDSVKTNLNSRKTVDSVLPSLGLNISHPSLYEKSHRPKGSSRSLTKPAGQNIGNSRQDGFQKFPSGPHWGFFSPGPSNAPMQSSSRQASSIPPRPRSSDISKNYSNERLNKEVNARRIDTYFKTPSQSRSPRLEPKRSSPLRQGIKSPLSPVKRNVTKLDKSSSTFQTRDHVSPTPEPSLLNHRQSSSATPKSSEPSSSVAPTEVSSSSPSASPPPRARLSRQTFVSVEIPQRRPFSTSNHSIDALVTPSLKRKFRGSENPLIPDNDHISQIQREISNDDFSTTSSESSVGVDPTDFSLANDSRDFPALFEPRTKVIQPDRRVLKFPETPLRLRPSRGTPYQRVLRQYQQKLAQMPDPPTTFSNTEDEMLPDGKFEFIETYILHPGVEKVPDDFNTGCSCFPQDDSPVASRGCDLASCGCVLQDGTGEGNGVRPYQIGDDGVVVLTDQILPLTVSIYECNRKCDCDDSCMNRVVQKGRTVPLEIFRAGQRGFGLRALKPLQKGQFIDLYVGEVLTAKQTKRREESTFTSKGSYLFALDMFRNDPDENYVVDGRYKGNATRFMNHSCKPNCKLFTVLCDHSDDKVYDLAFFAVKDIPQGTELTFDYNPNYEDLKGAEGGDAPAGGVGRGRKGVRSNVVEEEVAAKCLCGEDNCRGKVWL